MDNKRLYVVERKRDRNAVFVRASHIIYAHQEGEKEFKQEGFRVREATLIERSLVTRDQIVEAA